MAKNQQSFVIPLSSKGLLQEKLSYVEKSCDVKVVCQLNAKEDKNIWVNVTGSNVAKVLQAKTYVIAMCSPETTEKVVFPGFPTCFFDAFEEKCKQHIEMHCGVYMKVTDRDAVFLGGSNISVTLATSKIFHLHKLQQDKTSVKDGPYIRRFDQLVQESRDPNKQILSALSNALKKEILNMINMTSDAENNEEEETPGPSEIIVIEDSAISISSDSESIEVLSDDDVERDGPTKAKDPTVSHILPPTFVIVEWVKTHYIATNNTTDSVSKCDLLEHFRTHFDLKDHPNLSSEFYYKLANSLFARDPNYRCVKRKRGKRLRCFRRRSLGEEASAANSTRSATKVLDSSAKGIMKDWNANRTQAKNQNLPEAPGTSKPHAVTNDLKPLVPHVRPEAPKPVLDLVPSKPLQNWLLVQRPPMFRSTEYSIPARTTPACTAAATETAAARISKMSNQELLRSPRPPINPSLRPVIIDGSNVAMTHGNGSTFSCRGIAICVRYFMAQGHEQITCFVPNYRKGNKGSPPSKDSHLLFELESMGIVKSTPSRMIGHTNVVCYDDRFIVELAAANNGVILSNDQYRDLMAQNRRWIPVVERQLLQYTMVGDLLMLPEDPLGRKGPSLTNFMRMPNYQGAQNKIPPHQQPLLPFPPPTVPQAWRSPTRMPVRAAHGAGNTPRSSPARAGTVASPEEERLVREMLKVFPDRDEDIRNVILTHPWEKDITRLMNYMLLDQDD